jgi:hypothetical protein
MKFREIRDPLLRLLQDAQSAEDLLSNGDTQFARRAYVRCLFAFIEGAVWILKYACRNGKTPKGVLPVSPGEYALLGDVSYELKSSGELSEQPKFLRLQENVKFCAVLFNRLFGSKIDLKVGSGDWQKFITAIGIRNRITHPKHLSDFDITDEELKICQDTCLWFNDHVSEAVNGVVTSSTKAISEKKGPTSGSSQ